MIFYVYLLLAIGNEQIMNFVASRFIHAITFHSFVILIVYAGSEEENGSGKERMKNERNPNFAAFILRFIVLVWFFS